MIWKEKEIFKVYDEVYDLLSDSRYNYHCLLDFISCHGDSNGNKVPLITIFDKFSNQCDVRGDKRTKWFAKSNCLMVNEKTKH